MPRTAASGTDQIGLPLPSSPVMTPVGMILMSRWPMPAKATKNTASLIRDWPLR
ncbi:MAG: hypothetical protein ACYC1E_09630 [Propionibacteriaceae bacterium]